MLLCVYAHSLVTILCTCCRLKSSWVIRSYQKLLRTLNNLLKWKMHTTMQLHRHDSPVAGRNIYTLEHINSDHSGNKCGKCRNCFNKHHQQGCRSAHIEYAQGEPVYTFDEDPDETYTGKQLCLAVSYRLVVDLVCNRLSMLFADGSDTEDDVDAGPADAGLVDTSNIPSSSKQPPSAPSSSKQPPSAPSRRTKQTVRRPSGPADKQVNPQVAQILRLDKRDMKKLEEVVRGVQQDSKKMMEDAMARVQAEQAFQFTYKVTAVNLPRVLVQKGVVLRPYTCCRACGLTRKQGQVCWRQK